MIEKFKAMELSPGDRVTTLKGRHLPAGLKGTVVDVIYASFPSSHDVALVELDKEVSVESYQFSWKMWYLRSSEVTKAGL